MMNSIRHLFRPARAQYLPEVPEGKRVYAFGDIHGRLDLFTALVEAVEKDDLARSAAETEIILLGDLIDRGPDSAGVLEAARSWQTRRTVHVLSGNHEEMFLKSFDDLGAFRNFLRFGGDETVRSYPVDKLAFEQAELAEAQELMRQAVPEADLEFIRGFENFREIGDYLFVHAGIRPGEPVLEQDVHDLRWIRGDFLEHHEDFGHVVVHGHSIREKPEIRHNRIGIDTGAFMSGRLTALGLEGAERWLIETEELEGEISVSIRPA